MKKIAFVLCVILMITALVGCAEIVSERPIDVEYTAAYDSEEMEYSYKYDWVNGEFKYLPVGLKTIHHDAVYRVLYERTWSDGSVNTLWKTVTKEEYETALKRLEGGAE